MFVACTLGYLFGETESEAFFCWPIPSISCERLSALLIRGSGGVGGDRGGAAAGRGALKSREAARQILAPPYENENAKREKAKRFLKITKFAAT